MSSGNGGVGFLCRGVDILLSVQDVQVLSGIEFYCWLADKNLTGFTAGSFYNSYHVNFSLSRSPVTIINQISIVERN